MKSAQKDDLRGLVPFFSLDLDSVLLALIFASVVGLVVGLSPAVRASRLSPIDALRTA